MTHTFDPKAVREAWASAFPGYQAQDSLESVQYAMINFYRNVRAVDVDNPIVDPDDWENIIPEIEQALGVGGHTEGHQCGEQIMLGLSFFVAHGYDARPVSLYEAVDDVNYYHSPTQEATKTHAVIEVYVDGKWYAMDIYAGCMFQHKNGEFLSWTQIHNEVKLRTPGNVIPTRCGYKVGDYENPNLSGYDSGWAIEKVARNCVIGGSRTDGAVCTILSLDNQYWDGKLRYNQASIDQNPSLANPYDTPAVYNHNVYTQFYTFTPG